jgi:hypothetical protein
MANQFRMIFLFLLFFSTYLTLIFIDKSVGETPSYFDKKKQTKIAREWAPFTFADDDEGPDRPLNQTLSVAFWGQLCGWNNNHEL